jgi:hypothetical protein
MLAASSEIWPIRGVGTEMTRRYLRLVVLKRFWLVVGGMFTQKHKHHDVLLDQCSVKYLRENSMETISESILTHCSSNTNEKQK